MTPFKINNVNHSKIVRVQGLVSNSSCLIALDTGAEVNCVDEEFWKHSTHNQSTPTHATLQGADGTYLMCKGACELNVALNGHEWTDTFLIVKDLSQPILIGAPTLHTQRVDIVNSLNQVKVIRDNADDITIPFIITKQNVNATPTTNLVATVKENPHCMLSGFIHAAGDIIMPPRTERFICCKIIHGDKFKGVTFPALIQNAEQNRTMCKVGQGIANISNGYVNVTLANPNSEEITIPKGSVLGIFDGRSIDQYHVLNIGDLTQIPTNRKVQLIKQDLIDSKLFTEDVLKDLPDDLNITDAGTNLATNQIRQLIHVLTQYNHLFSVKDAMNHSIDAAIAEHSIDLMDNSKPISGPPYRTSPENRKIIEENLHEMLITGVIRESRSPWASPVVLVPKKGGKIRFAIDYRKLNDVTKK
jgi:hypothetical protein